MTIRTLSKKSAPCLPLFCRLGAAVLTVLPLSAASPLVIAEVKRDKPVDFAKDVYPLLKRSCLACHNTTKAKAGLNLESPQTILKGGDTGPAAAAGKGMESLLLRSAAHIEEAAMPPPGNKVNAPDLTPEELGLLKLWIDQGLKGGALSENVAEWRTFPTHRPPVAAVAFSASGRIAAAARGNQIHLTEVATGISLGHLVDPELAKLELYQKTSAADRDAVMSLAFGGDDLLASGGFRTVRLWRRAPFAGLGMALELPAAAVSFAATSGVAAAGDEKGVIRLWNPTEEKPVIRECRQHNTPVKALAISPDSKFFVSAALGRKVVVWSVASGQPVFQADAPDEVTALCFLKNGTELASSSADGLLRIYPFSREIPSALPPVLREWKVAAQPAQTLIAPDPAGTQILWINQEPSLRLTDSADGKLLADTTLENPAQLAIGHAGRRQQAHQRQSDARKARLTAASETVKKENENLLSTHQGQEKTRADWQRKLALAQSAAASWRASSDDKARKESAGKTATEAATAERAFADARTNAELAVRLTGLAMQNQAAAEGAAAAAGTALAENTSTLEALKKALTPLPALRSLTLLDGGKTALVALEGGHLQWHSVASGEYLDSAEGAATGPGPTLLAPASSGVLAARFDNKVTALPSRRPFIMERLIGNPDDPAILSNRVISLSFSSDARLLASGGGVPSRSGEAKIWNTADGSAVLALADPHSDTINAIAFSPDDSLLATAGSDRWARVFQVSDGKKTASFEGHSGQVLGITWRSDGLALATGGADKTLRYWDLLDSKQTRSVTSFGKEVSAVAWLGTGDTVASGGGDSNVRLNEEVLPGAKGFCFTVASDPSGKLLAAGGEDGILRIWQTGIKKLLREVP